MKPYLSQRGSALLELALIVPILVLGMSVAIDFGLAFKEHSLMTEATYVGTRSAAIQPSGTPGATISSAASLTTSTFLTLSGLTPTNYQMEITPLTLPLQSGGTAPGVQVTLSRSAAGRFFILPNNAFSSCVKSVAVLADSNVATSVPPGAQPAC